jgi:hypothetical protein
MRATVAWLRALFISDDGYATARWLLFAIGTFGRYWFLELRPEYSRISDPRQ